MSSDCFDWSFWRLRGPLPIADDRPDTSAACLADNVRV
jgi:hypothetical protein